MNEFPFDRTSDVPVQLLEVGGEITRRSMLKVGTVAGLGAVGGFAFTAPACPDKKNLSFWDETIIGALEEVSLIVTSQAANIKKIVAVIRDFDAAYKAEQFANALSLFTNLTSLIDTLITDLGVGISPVIKTALTLANIGIRAIALLLKQQGENIPAVVNASPSPQIENVRKLANLKAIDAIYQASRP